MAASILISLNDSGYGGLSEVLNDLGGGASSSTTLKGPEVMLRLGNYIRGLAGAGSYAGTLRVSGTSATRASGTVTLTNLPVADETVTFGATVLTWKASAANENQVTIGGTAALTATALATAINAHSVASKLFVATNPTSTTVLVTCLTPGLVGNGIVFAEASSNLTMNGSGYLGGTTAGAGHDSAVQLRWIGPSGGTVY